MNGKIMAVIGAMSVLPTFAAQTNASYRVDFSLDLTTAVRTNETLVTVGPVTVILRMAGRDGRLRGYDERAGNYLNFAQSSGDCPVIEAVLPAQSIRAGVPLACLDPKRSVHQVQVREEQPRLSIEVDGRAYDENYTVPSCPVVIWPEPLKDEVRSRRVEAVRITPLPEGCSRRPEADATPVVGSIQYWTPPQHNTWVGDVAPLYANGKLHVFYLIDRRHHSSGFGTGRHQFAHLETSDLTHWVERPLAVAIREDWQTCGTGTPFMKGHELALAFGWHTSRYPERKGFPLGGTYATSADGIHFTNSGKIISDAQNPSIYNRPEGGYELVTSYGGSIGIFRSSDLTDWKLFDAKLPFRGDCPSLFDWHGHRYLLQGFTNMAYSPDGTPGSFVNWTALPDALYEGLSVPMVTGWKGDRRLYAGWLAHLFGWGGWLVFREVVYYPDGHLGLKWVPEITPPVPPRTYSRAAGEKLELRFTPEKGGVPLLLSVDPATREAFFADETKPLVFDARRCAAKNMKIGGVRGLDAPYAVKVIAFYDAKAGATIFDAEIAGQRTMIVRRAGRYQLP